jgi:hypothetical protein
MFDGLMMLAHAYKFFKGRASIWKQIHTSICASQGTDDVYWIVRSAACSMCFWNI